MTPEQEQELLAEMRALKEQVLETSERLARMERTTGRLLLVLDGEAVVPAGSNVSKRTECLAFARAAPLPQFFGRPSVG